MVHNRLYRFLEQNNAFCNYQFGFRNNHSTNHALTEITEQIQNAMTNISSLAKATLSTCEV